MTYIPSDVIEKHLLSRNEIYKAKLFLADVKKLSRKSVTPMGGKYCTRVMKRIKDAVSKDYPSDMYPNICEATYFEFAQMEYSEEREIFESSDLAEVAIAQIVDADFRAQSLAAPDFGKVWLLFLEKYGGQLGTENGKVFSTIDPEELSCITAVHDITLEEIPDLPVGLM